MNEIDTQLELILLDMANEVLDLHSNNSTIGAPIIKAKGRIDRLYGEALEKAIKEQLKGEQ